MTAIGIENSSAVLSSSARALIREHVRSIEQLDILLWLGARSNEWHGLETITEELGLSPSVTENAVAHLARQQAVIVAPGNHPRVCYAPKSTTIIEAAAQLGQRYAQARVHALMYISTCAIERARLAHDAAVPAGFRRT